MNNFGSCLGCGKAISYDRICVCMACDAKYRTKVKEYVREHENATADEVAKAVGVSVKLVNQYSKVGVISSIDSEMADRRRRLQLMALKQAVSEGALQEEPKKQFGMTGKYHFLTKEYREAHPNRYR